jgi:spore coat protein H
MRYLGYMKKLLICATFFHLIALFSKGQAPLPFDEVYAQNEVSEIRITIHPDSLALMYSDVVLGANHEFPATFRFVGSTVNETFENIGFRLRGNTSLTASKKSFKVSFNTFSDTTWRGYEKLNLVGMHNDPSLMRSKLCHDLYRSMGVPAARTSFVKVYLNDQYAGLYVNQEHLDENWVEKYFGQYEDGNLYKCTYPSTLEYLGADQNLYKTEQWGTRPYELKTNNWKDDYTDLVSFIAILNNTPLASLPCNLEKVFDVDKYLRTAAVDVLVGNWDGHIYNKNNFYLYHNQRTNQFVYSPYDLDNTLGIDWIGIDWSQRNIYNWAPSNQERPLFKRLMQVSDYRNRFSSYLNELIEGEFSVASMQSKCNQWRNLIQAFVEVDPFYPLDYGFTYNDFLNADLTAWGNQVAYGIVDYAEARIASCLNQLEPITTPSVQIESVVPVQPLFEADNEVVVLTNFNENFAGCTAQFSNDASVWSSGSNVQFGAATQTTWPASNVTTDKVYYRNNCSNGESFPCNFDYIWATESSIPLFINEVMPINDNAFADDQGEFADWCELYNASASSINLQGFYLTDKARNNYNKFPLPNVTIGAGQFMIFYLDNEPSASVYHANFRLSGNERHLYLFRDESQKPRLVDSLAWSTTLVNQSVSRVPDGGDVLVISANSTPGTSNGANNISEQSMKVLCFPNPASSMLYFADYLTDVVVLDVYGHKIMEHKRIKELNVEELPNGVYFVHSHESIHKVVVAH